MEQRRTALSSGGQLQLSHVDSPAHFSAANDGKIKFYFRFPFVELSIGSFLFAIEVLWKM